MKCRIIFILLLIGFTRLNASHIVGGEIYYDDLGAGNYKITLKIYRDCLNGLSNFDGLLNTANNTIIDPTLSVFDNNGNYVTQFVLSPPIVDTVPSSINNPCISTPNSVCIEEGTYTKVVHLTPRTGGYYIVYQRCCRGTTILNLLTPSSFGATYYAHIPGPEVAATNSSPRFKKLPPLYVCNGIPIGFDHSAIDPDGDVLVYTFCAPFEGLENCCGYVPVGAANPTVVGCGVNCPPNNRPPYNSLTFIPPYSGTYPVSSNPVISIHPNTGMINGSPDINGQWTVGVQVAEYRNNVLIGLHYRDYVFNVVSCIVPVLSVFNPQNSLCVGSTLTFTNNSIGGTTWHWDFGVNSLTNDTSNIATPNYTYPDTGKYQVTLIANPGKPCADTSRQTVFIYPPLTPSVVPNPPQCLKNNSFNFNITGQFTPYASINWNFGINATPNFTNVQHPTNVVYNQAGTYTVQLIMHQNICSATVVDTVKVFPQPTVKVDSTTLTLCAPAAVTFSNINTYNFPANYNWSFSNGTLSSVKNPTVTFSQAGIYSTTVTVIVNNGCLDTNTYILTNLITVNPKPQAGYTFSPTVTSIFEPDISFFDNSQNASSWYYNFADGSTSSSASPLHHYENYGDFYVTQIVTNPFGCTDTTTQLIKILPEFRYWVPNSFTPGNNDGMNDEFTPVTYGVEDYKFSVYDRWGECIFNTIEPNKGWNGTYNGSNCQPDTYDYLIVFKNVVTKRYEWHYGHVNLLK